MNRYITKTFHNKYLIPLFTSLLLLAGFQSDAQAFKWEAAKYQGRDHVTLRSVKSFYFFDKITYGSSIVLYRAQKIQQGKKTVEVEMKFRSGSNSCYMNGVLFVLSHPVVKSNGRYLISRTDLVKLIDPVLRPSHIRSAKPFKTVVIDAGHGGKDSGSLGFYKVHEKYYALKVARMARDQLQKLGYQVVMTRDSDVFVSLGNRVRIANKYPNAIFISIHFNSGGNARANGVETFTISPVGVPHMGRGVRERDFRMVPGNITDSASIALATAVHSRMLLYLNEPKYGNNFKIKDRGIKRARFNVLTGIRIPAVLMEGGFISNRTEARKVHSIAYQKSLAAAVVRAVNVYNKSISRR
ncbi:MAG: N-acetylmuramoyl-L-alanine amidase [Akkermansiaceae bacterium]